MSVCKTQDTEFSLSALLSSPPPPPSLFPNARGRAYSFVHANVIGVTVSFLTWATWNKALGLAYKQFRFIAKMEVLTCYDSQ